MACQVEQIADCGDISTIARALFVPDKEDANWLSQCAVSLSSCGSLLAVGHGNRMCLLTSQWISSTDSNVFLITWSGSLPYDITTLLAVPICPSQQSSQNSPDWFCIMVGFKNGSVGFYTNTGHNLLMEKFDEKPVLKITCHTGTFGTLPDDVCVFYQNCECIVNGSNLFQTLRYAKAQLARVQAGIKNEYTVDGRSLTVNKWTFNDQYAVNDAGFIGLELKNTYDHLLAASTYGGYDTWYRSVPPANSLILGAGSKPYIGFHYALEGGAAPPLQDVARAVANKIKSALPGWLGGGSDTPAVQTEARIRSEGLSMRSGLSDPTRNAASVTVSPDRRLAAVTDNLGRVAVVDVNRGYIVRLIKGCRDAQCAFMQVFEEGKKQHLTTIKETRRAMFLIIYNPKKGLIDIRLMHRGNRVAVFTATKNARLLYNTCGLVGTEVTFSHKKLNLPEFQCVLIDPDGKLKRFNIPFFYALEGEHSDRSKDLHILREMREYLKSTQLRDYSKEEIIKKVTNIKTLDLKKHCLEMLIRNYCVPPKIVMACLSVFWNSDYEDPEGKSEEIKNYFRNLVLVTLLYRRFNGETIDDMNEIVEKVHSELNIVVGSKIMEEDQADKYDLLVDDDCVLERLLLLSKEKDYKDHQQSRVTFADNTSNTFKDFVTSFDLEQQSKKLRIKTDISPEKLTTLASITFKCLIKIDDPTNLRSFVVESNIDTTDIIKLVITHIMNMSLEDLSLELIKKLIAVIYYVCYSNVDASTVSYNEVSDWWQNIRDLIVDLPCPLRSMVVAMACKAVEKLFEQSSPDENSFELLTKENAKWDLLIGKLEDISILSIILHLKETYNGKALPKLYGVDMDINLKLIYTRGKGSVTELISKWLCSMGVPPEAVIVNELMDKNAETDQNQDDSLDDADQNTLFLEDNRQLVDNNPRIFKWLSLLRQQFPYSTCVDYILVNMCWEYALAWQKDLPDLEKLSAVLKCLKYISDMRIRLGLTTLLWTTYIKQVFENACRLINKVGKLPKERLCQQDVGLNDVAIVKFLETTTLYLKSFLDYSSQCSNLKKRIQFEKIWDDSTQSLIEVARDTKRVNTDILSLNYQISCTIYYQCHFNLKVTKPLNSLYDIDYHFVFESLMKNDLREINMRPSEKLRHPRMKFLNKVIKGSIETISCVENNSGVRSYDSSEYAQWAERVALLADMWGVEADFVRRQQVIGLYQSGYDALAETAASQVTDVEALLPPLLGITAQRLKWNLEQSANPSEWIASMPPTLVVHVNGLISDTSVATHPPLPSTLSFVTQILHLIEKKTPVPTNKQNVKLAELMVKGCETIIELNL